MSPVQCCTSASHPYCASSKRRPGGRLWCSPSFHSPAGQPLPKAQGEQRAAPSPTAFTEPAGSCGAWIQWQDSQACYVTSMHPLVTQCCPVWFARFINLELVFMSGSNSCCTELEGAPCRDAEVAEVLHAPGFALHYAQGIRQRLSLLSGTLTTGCAPRLLV